MNTLLRSASVLALATTALAAHADAFTESVQFGPGLTDFNASTGTTAGPGGNQLYLFDSNGGTLNSITFSYSYSLSSQITITNTSANASSGNVRTQSAAQFSSNNSAVTTALNSVVNSYVDPLDGNSVSFGGKTLSPLAADVRGNATSYSLAPGSSTSSSSSGSYSKPSFTVTNAAILGAFSKAGGGTFTPLFTTLTGLLVSNSGGNTLASQVATGQGNLTLTYNYSNPVPEPGTWAALGLGALSFVKRRKR